MPARIWPAGVTADLRLETPDMTRYEPTEVEPDDLPTGVHYLGVDGDGEQHYMTNPVGGPTIFVTDDQTNGGLLRFDLDEHDLVDWVRHVEDQRGAWQLLNYERGVDGRRVQEVGA